MKNTVKNKNTINDLFTKSKTLSTKSLFFRYMKGDNLSLVTVSTKNFKRAVDRNRIKRLLREVLRGEELGTVALVYTGKTLPTLEDLKKEFEQIKNKLSFSRDGNFSIKG